MISMSDGSAPGTAKPTAILKITADAERSEAIELGFDLDFLSGLSIAERFELMFARSREIAELLRAHGHGASASILKRS